MRIRVVEVLLVTALAFAIGGNAAQGEASPVDVGGEITPAISAPAPPPGWLERERLTGDWGGGRTWLKEHGITLEPRLTQFYQGMPAGDGDNGFEYSGKADLLLNADLGKLGLWNGSR